MGKGKNRRDFLKLITGLGGVITGNMLFNSCQGTESGIYSVNSSLCSGCKKCLSACSSDAISISNNKAYVNSSKCIGCGHCASVCSQKAISQV